jgi:hypothetical protein
MLVLLLAILKPQACINLLTLIQINLSFQFSAIVISIVFKKILTGQLTRMAQHKPPPSPPRSPDWLGWW